MTHKTAFTLIEVLIVVIILAVLAGTVISHFLGTADDAKESMLLHNMHLLETQIEVYRAQHNNTYPEIIGSRLPQLVNPTNSLGETGPAGPAYPYGPYLLEEPVNPYDGSKNVVAVETPGEKPAGTVGSDGGWQYDAGIGAVWPNHPEYYK